MRNFAPGIEEVMRFSPNPCPGRSRPGTSFLWRPYCSHFFSFYQSLYLKYFVLRVFFDPLQGVSQLLELFIGEPRALIAILVVPQ